MMMSTMTLFAQAACEAGKVGAKCPVHAVAALVGALVVGILIGFFLGRRGKACACSAQSKSQQKRREPAPRREARP